MVAYPNFSESSEEFNSVENKLPQKLNALTIAPVDGSKAEISSSNVSEQDLSSTQPEQTPKLAIRSSLKASTLDSIFAAIFGSVTSGVLLSNFLLRLGATPVEIGMLSSIPMITNFLQPLGAYIADRNQSRQWYCLWIFAPARLLWLVLVAGIAWASFGNVDHHQLVIGTLGIVLLTSILIAMGCASWLSWMAALVPTKLRGRYFGVRNSAASLTTLLCVPVLGLGVSAWSGGEIQGYGIVLCLGILAGLVSLVCQFFMKDVNPQEQGKDQEGENNSSIRQLLTSISPNFSNFLIYFGVWAFAVNVSEPFFNLYMLDNLHLNVSCVTVYSSLRSGANLLMLLVWGKLADRIGNRPLLMLVGVAVSIIPCLWLGIGSNSLSVWFWLPVLHLFAGGAWAAVELCGNNLQMSIAPERNQATYFAIAAAVAGICGAIGTTVGGFLAEFDFGGLRVMFALSAFLRVGALFPLIFVHEQRSMPVRQILRSLLPIKSRLAAIPVLMLADKSK